MYMIDTMIDMGLEKDKEWPSDVHRQVAINLLICNPRITTMDALMTGIKKVNSIPIEEIKIITYEGLEKYGFHMSMEVTI